MAEPNRFVWYELATTDRPAAEAFYAAVVGWTFADSGLPGIEYGIFSAGPVMLGGMVAAPSAPPAWAGYVAVDDVDAHAARMVQAGGAVLRPASDMPGVGRMATVADPQGALFVLFRSASGATPPHGVPAETPGHVGWHELHAADGTAAFAFYADMFGWTADHVMDMGPMGLYQIFKIGDGQAGGMMTKTPATPAPHWLYYVSVADITSAASRVAEGGGVVLNGPHEVPGGLFVVQCRDPQGAGFALVGPKG